MSFSVSVSLGTVGRSITSVKLFACTNSSCTNGTEITGYENVLVSSFPLTVDGVPDSTTHIKISALGLCSSTQCLSISGLIVSSPTPTPTVTPTVTPTTNVTPVTTYVYYKLRPCNRSNDTGYSSGTYDVWSKEYVSGTFNTGDRVEGVVDFFYVVVGSIAFNNGDSSTYGTITVTRAYAYINGENIGLVGCNYTPPPTYRTIKLFGFTKGLESVGLEQIKTDLCNLYPYQIPTGYGPTGPLWIDGTTFTVGTQYYVWTENIGGSLYDGGNKWYGVLLPGESSIRYVVYITSNGLVQDWTACGVSP